MKLYELARRALAALLPVHAAPSFGSAGRHRNGDARCQKGSSKAGASGVREDATASGAHDVLRSQDGHGQAQARYGFNDSRGSFCPFASAAIDGAVATEAPGVGGKDGHHFLRWHSHPDGSPDSPGWSH